jgi:hypothetical protein
MAAGLVLAVLAGLLVPILGHRSVYAPILGLYSKKYVVVILCHFLAITASALVLWRGPRRAREIGASLRSFAFWGAVVLWGGAVLVLGAASVLADSTNAFRLAEMLLFAGVAAGWGVLCLGPEWRNWARGADRRSGALFPRPDAVEARRQEAAPRPWGWPEVLVLLLGVAAWWPAVGAYYCWDDFYLLIRSTFVLDSASFRDYLLEPHNAHVFPLTRLFYYAVMRCRGVEAWPVMAFNMALWLGLGAWLLHLGRRWFSTREAALIPALVFLVSHRPVQAVLWPLAATNFVIPLALTFAGLAGAQAGLRARKGLWAGAAVFAACLAAPMGSLVGLLAAPIVVGAIWLAPDVEARWRRRFGISAAALGGMAAFLAFYASVGRPEVDVAFARNDGSLLPGVDLLGGAQMTLIALFWRLGADFGLPGVSAVVSVAALSGLILRRGHGLWARAGFFAIWASGSLAYVYVFRTWAGGQVTLWGRYYVFALPAWGGLLACGVEAWLSGADGAAARRQVRRAWVLALVGVFALGSAGWTAMRCLEYVRISRPTRAFCRDWARAPEAYMAATGMRKVRLPLAAIAVPNAPDHLRLNDYAGFCWEGGLEWEIDWAPPDGGFSPEFVEFVAQSDLYALQRRLAPLIPGFAQRLDLEPEGPLGSLSEF